MARMKKTSKVAEDAKERLSGIKAIENIRLGGGLSVAGYEKWIDDTEDALETYNTSLSVADDNKYALVTKEKGLKDYHERILLSVATEYGKDSIEYEKAGGTRKSERKKPVKKKKTEDK